MGVYPDAGRIAMLAGMVLIGAGLVSPAEATGRPPGNNGTIKVDGWEVDNRPANEPHVGCEFGIDFYGYEANLPVTMVFEVQQPTGDEVIHTESGTLDDDDASGGGSEAGHDGHFDIDLGDALAGFDPHPVQGYHLKLTVTVSDEEAVQPAGGGGHGAEVKHKVFWSTACVPPVTTITTTSTTVPETTTTTTTTVPETTTTTTTTVPETTTTTTTTVPETTTTTTTVPETTTTTSASVAPTVITQTTGGTEVLGVQLVRTGIGSQLLAVGGAFFVAGMVIELLLQDAKRRREQAA